MGLLSVCLPEAVHVLLPLSLTLAHSPLTLPLTLACFRSLLFALLITLTCAEQQTAIRSTATNSS